MICMEGWCTVAARLTDRQKKKILADYVQLGSYNATAKINGCSLNTVKKLVQENADIAELCIQKKNGEHNGHSGLHGEPAGNGV